MPKCRYASKYYKVPADIGRRVVVGGKPGIIAEDRGQYIGVLFDDAKPNNILPCHPTWMVEYLDMGKIRQMTRSQQRYQDYLNAECNESFSEWMGFPAKEKNYGPAY